MFAYEPPLDPPCSYWEEYGKPKFIEETVKDICKDITKFPAIFDVLYEYIEDNIEKFLPERSYDE